MSLFFSSRKLTKNFNRTETTREKTSLALNISLCVLSSNHGTGYHSNDNNGEREREKSWWCSSGNNNNNKTNHSFSLFRGELLRRLLLPRLLLLLGVEPGVNGQRVAAQGEHARGLVLGGKVRAGLEGVATVFLEVGGGGIFFWGGGEVSRVFRGEERKKKSASISSKFRKAIPASRYARSLSRIHISQGGNSKDRPTHRASANRHSPRGSAGSKCSSPAAGFARIATRSLLLLLLLPLLVVLLLASGAARRE